MRKSRLADMTEAELDELAFELDECQFAKGKPLSMTRWRTRIGNRVKEVQEESGLGERPERYSPAWLYMLYAREALAEADRHDADELPFRLYEIYGEKFQHPFTDKDAESADQPPTGDQPSAVNEPQPQSTEPPTTEASEMPSTAPTGQSPAKPPTTDPVPQPVPDVPVVPDVPATTDETPPDADSSDSAATEVDWNAF